MPTLQELRQEKGMMRQELAKELGVSVYTVASWERGDREPRLKQFKRIADFFGVPMDDLVIKKK